MLGNRRAIKCQDHSRLNGTFKKYRGWVGGGGGGWGLRSGGWVWGGWEGGCGCVGGWGGRLSKSIPALNKEKMGLEGKEVKVVWWGTEGPGGGVVLHRRNLWTNHPQEVRHCQSSGLADPRRRVAGKKEGGWSSKGGESRENKAIGPVNESWGRSTWGGGKDLKRKSDAVFHTFSWGVRKDDLKSVGEKIDGRRRVKTELRT